MNQAITELKRKFQAVNGLEKIRLARVILDVRNIERSQPKIQELPSDKEQIIKDMQEWIDEKKSSGLQLNKITPFAVVNYLSSYKDKYISANKEFNPDGHKVNFDKLEDIARELLVKNGAVVIGVNQPESSAIFGDDDLNPNSPNYRYKDTGYIAGSKKELAARAAEIIKKAAKDGDLVRASAIDFDSIEDNPREAKALITKSNLLGKIDWNKHKDNGMEPAAAFLIDRIIYAIPKEPVLDNPQARRDYVIGLETLHDRLEQCKTVADVQNLLDEINEQQHGIILTAEESEQYKALYADYLVKQQALESARVEYREEKYKISKIENDILNYEGYIRKAKRNKDSFDRRISAEQSQNFIAKYEGKIVELQEQQARQNREFKKYELAHPDLNEKRNYTFSDGSERETSALAYQEHEAWIKTDAIKKTAQTRAKDDLANSGTINQITRSWAVMGDKFSETVDYRRHYGKTFYKHVATARTGKPDNWDWAKLEPKEPVTETDVGEPKEKGKTKFQLKVSDSFERVGGRTVSVKSTIELKSQFGLRDVQSGNYVLKDKSSAEFHVQQSAAAFADLADLIGVPDHLISMKGNLALAFGARGSGSALAHYEPVQRVINITKMKGGGSLAHEWFHAMDNMMAEVFSGQAAGVDTYLTSNPEKITSPELTTAFRNLKNALLEGNTRARQIIEYTDKDYRQGIHNFDRPRSRSVQVIKDTGNATDAAIYITENQNRFNGWKSWIKIAVAYFDGKPEGGIVEIASGLPVSKFLADAIQLDRGRASKYWSKTLEMAARAFSAWCEDRLGEQGRKNHYLSNHSSNDVYLEEKVYPFPAGEERATINKAFDELFKAIRDTNTLQVVLDSLFGDVVLDSVQDLKAQWQTASGVEKIALARRIIEERKNQPVKSNPDATIILADAIKIALTNTNGQVTTGDKLIWEVNKTALNKMTAGTNKDGKKAYQHERIIAIQSLVELSKAAVSPLIRSDDGRDDQTEAIYEYHVPFEINGKTFDVRLLCKKWKKPFKNQKDKMHSMAMDDVNDDPASQANNDVIADGLLDDLELVLLDVIEGADSTLGLPDLSPSVANGLSIAQTESDATKYPTKQPVKIITPALFSKIESKIMTAIKTDIAKLKLGKDDAAKAVIIAKHFAHGAMTLLPYNGTNDMEAVVSADKEYENLGIRKDIDDIDDFALSNNEILLKKVSNAIGDKAFNIVEDIFQNAKFDKNHLNAAEKRENDRYLAGIAEYAKATIKSLVPDAKDFEVHFFSDMQNAIPYRSEFESTDEPDIEVSYTNKNGDRIRISQSLYDGKFEMQFLKEELSDEGGMVFDSATMILDDTTEYLGTVAGLKTQFQTANGIGKIALARQILQLRGLSINKAVNLSDYYFVTSKGVQGFSGSKAYGIINPNGLALSADGESPMTAKTMASAKEQAKYADGFKGYSWVKIYNSIEEARAGKNNATNPNAVLEPNSDQSGNENGNLQETVFTERDGDRPSTGRTGQSTGTDGNGEQGNPGLSTDSPVTGRTGGNPGMGKRDGEFKPGAGTANGSGSTESGGSGILPDRAANIGLANAIRESKQLDSIRADLPFLLHEQQNDIIAIEKRFEKAEGMMITNGTGTGKTYTALGAIKRFAKQGKDSILIVVPGNKIQQDFIDSGKDLHLNIKKLTNTQDNGSVGIGITTYSNFYQNENLMRREWDLVVFDEAHKINSNQDGVETEAQKMMRKITNHKSGTGSKLAWLTENTPEIKAKFDDFDVRWNAIVKPYDESGERFYPDSLWQEQLNPLKEEKKAYTESLVGKKKQSPISIGHPVCL